MLSGWYDRAMTSQGQSQETSVAAALEVATPTIISPGRLGSTVKLDVPSNATGSTPGRGKAPLAIHLLPCFADSMTLA